MKSKEARPQKVINKLLKVINKACFSNFFSKHLLNNINKTEKQFNL